MRTVLAIPLLVLWLFGTAEATIISVGGGGYSSLQAAIDAANAGDTVEVSAGTYSGANGVAIINNAKTGLTIRGVGGAVTLDAAGYVIPNQKAIFVIQGAGVTIEDIGFANAAVPDNNGAGIRLEAPGTFTCEGCTFTGNQDGILTYHNESTELVIRGSMFTDSGACDGASHGIYAGGIGSVSVTGSTFSGTCIGHDIKSRAAYTHISGNNLSCDLTGSASYQVDMPNGGVGVVTNNCMGKSPDSDNEHAVAYAAECIGCWGENSLLVAGNTFNAPFEPWHGIYGTGVVQRLLINFDPSVTAVVSNNNICRLNSGGPFVVGDGGSLLSGNTENTACLQTDVPEPATVLLLSFALIGIASLRRRRRS